MPKPANAGAGMRPSNMAALDFVELGHATQSVALGRVRRSMPTEPAGSARPTSASTAAQLPTQPLLEVRDLHTHFPVRRGPWRRRVGEVRSVDGVSFELLPGETLGLVGESGCGKTTLARTILRLIRPTAGTIRLAGEDLTSAQGQRLRRLRRHLQIIFQDPMSSLNPRLRVGTLIAESMVIQGWGTRAKRRQRVAELLEQVGLPATAADRYPHEFSGGQRQRIGIARALALDPQLIVCDEPVSALDVSIQAQVLNLLQDLQAETGTAYLLIAHNLAVVEHLSRRIAVMYLGRFVELGPARAVCSRPWHPYTRALRAAVPVPDPAARPVHETIRGELPSPLHVPTGCRFHPRCRWADERCRAEQPELRPLAVGPPEHAVACHHAEALQTAD